MNPMLREKHRLLKDSVAKLSCKEFAPVAAQVDRTSTFPWENFRKLAQQGLTGMNVPEEFGGSGVDTLSFVLTMEEVARACASTALVLLSHHFVTQGKGKRMQGKIQQVVPSVIS